jgi:hypothetical protein
MLSCPLFCLLQFVESGVNMFHRLYSVAAPLTTGVLKLTFENDTPEPFLNPMCFRGGSDGREVHGMEWRGREQNNNSEIVGWQVRVLVQ